MGSIPNQTAARSLPPPDFYLLNKDDVLYEQDLFRNPGSTRPWLAYIDAKLRDGTIHEQAYIMERACMHLPRSYKLWKMYLQFRVDHLAKRNPGRHGPEFEKVNALFERALVLLNKMPVIWEMYLQFLLRQPLITRTRRTFDKALRALPVTQHNRIWKPYKQFARVVGGETAVNIWARYVQLHPEDMEDHIDALIEAGHYHEAVLKYIVILNDRSFVSKKTKSEFQLWNDMIDLIISKASDLEKIKDGRIDVDAIMKSGIDRFPDQRGKLYAGLATYHITLSSFHRARDVFEEGITTAMTVRDFTMIFDAYVEFEETLLQSLMDAQAARQSPDEESDFELDMSLARFEYLLNRRPFLLSDVLLRQNSNNISEWQKRVKLWDGNDQEIVNTYSDAIATVQPKKAIGKLSDLFVAFAKFYEQRNDLSTARIIFDKAVKVPYKSVAELADTYIAWAELELRHENFDTAFAIMTKSTAAPKKSTVDYFDETLTPQQRLHKSWKCWSFHIDLAESVLPLSEVRDLYDRVFELKIATPQTVVNYANLLQEHNYHEDSFRIYERGLDLFSYPVAFELWNLYLTQAVKRRISLERLRDLFEQALENCPPELAKPLFLLYGQVEEDRGLARSAMRIYDRAASAVSDIDRPGMYEFYITKAASNFGIASTRPIYERAIAALPDKDAAVFCLRFAEMERKLGEIDRARAILAHGSQFADPTIDKAYWKTWDDFEVMHGNEDTYKEMLRIGRSVAAKFDTEVGYVAQQVTAPTDGDMEQDRELTAMEALEKQARAPAGFIAASTGPVGGLVSVQAEEAAATNPDAVDLGEDEDD